MESRSVTSALQPVERPPMTKDEQFAAVREFARRVLFTIEEGGDLSETDIQDWASELGLVSADTAEATEGAHALADWMQTPSPPDGLPYR